jgi:hypothetical protein
LEKPVKDNRKMTTGNIASKKERKSMRNNPVDENAPLLPKRQEDVGFDEFNGASFTGDPCANFLGMDKLKNILK